MDRLIVLVPHSGKPTAALELHNAFKDANIDGVDLVFAVEKTDATHDFYYYHLTQADGKAISTETGIKGLVEAIRSLQKPAESPSKAPATPKKAPAKRTAPKASEGS